MPCNTAAQAVSRIATSVEEHQKEIDATQNDTYGDGGDADRAINEIEDAFSADAGVGVRAVEVTTRLTSPAKTPCADQRRGPFHEAVIHLPGAGAVRIRCRRNGCRLHVEEVVTTVSGHISRVRPDAADAARLDVYASTILQAWGL